jgi:hypothetical protein
VRSADIGFLAVAASIMVLPVLGALAVDLQRGLTLVMPDKLFAPPLCIPLFSAEERRGSSMMFLNAAPRAPENGRFRQLRFSPNGRYVLAADDTSVAVVNTNPFAYRFSVAAQNIHFIGFSSDSSVLSR